MNNLIELILKLGKVDRRWIFLIIGIVVLLPLLLGGHRAHALGGDRDRGRGLFDVLGGGLLGEEGAHLACNHGHQYPSWSVHWEIAGRSRFSGLIRRLVC